MTLLDAPTSAGLIVPAKPDPGENLRWERRYRDHLLGEGLSERTVREYVRKMKRVEEWAIRQGTHPSSMSAAHVHELAKTFPQTLGSLGQLRSALKYYWERSEEHTSELQSRENLVCR